MNISPRIAGIVGVAIIVGVSIPMMPMKWFVGMRLHTQTESVSSESDGPQPFQVAQRVKRNSNGFVPKGAFGTVTGTPADSEDCSEGRYKVVFDKFPRLPSSQYWCVKYSQIDLVN